MIASILIRYGEIALKGKNRRFFEDALKKNINRALTGIAARAVKKHGRFIVEGSKEHTEEIVSRLKKVFGIVSVSLVHKAPLDLEAIKKEAVRLLETVSCQTFKIETRRPNKNFPYTSPEINRGVGAYVLEIMPHLKVDVHRPDIQISIEVGIDNAYLYSDQVKGPGGLPVGVTGKSLVLLSGGIDSPVAAWMAMKRGLAIEAVHFHSFPFTSLQSREKVIDLCRTLAEYCGEIPLHLVNVTGIQKQLHNHCPAKLSVILLRRVMLKIAEQLCNRRNLQAITTGESLGQVASQTLESITVISAATGTLILRPLLAMDKHEIVSVAEQIGTYHISIRPYEDCCTLFVPSHPSTRPHLQQVEKAETLIDIDTLIKESLDTMETLTLSAYTE